MSYFTSDRKVQGQCDRCGFTFKLSELKYEIYDRQNTRKRICPSCYDKDHPQLRLGERSYEDPFPVEDPRLGDDAFPVYPHGWNPVGYYEVSVELAGFQIQTS